MSLPVEPLRQKLRELIKLSKRGYMAALASLSGIPDATIYRIAFGKQQTVTYKIWQQLHRVAPELPAPPSMQEETHAATADLSEDFEMHCFVTSLQHVFLMHDRFKKAEDLALSVGLRTRDIKSLLKGDHHYIPGAYERKAIAHAFGMRLDDFVITGKRILDEEKAGLRNLEILKQIYDYDSATTNHPDIVQIVKMAEKLDDDQIRIVKDLTLKLFISSIDGNH